MNPREIEVHIEEVVLHGFDPRSRWNVRDALESELRGLLAAKGIPQAWLSSRQRIDAGTTRTANLTKPAQAGAEIAGATYRGSAK
jgi:hypothetical protein